MSLEYKNIISRHRFVIKGGSSQLKKISNYHWELRDIQQKVLRWRKPGNKLRVVQIYVIDM